MNIQEGKAVRVRSAVRSMTTGIQLDSSSYYVYRYFGHTASMSELYPQPVHLRSGVGKRMQDRISIISERDLLDDKDVTEPMFHVSEIVRLFGNMYRRVPAIEMLPMSQIIEYLPKPSPTSDIMANTKRTKQLQGDLARAAERRGSLTAALDIYSETLAATEARPDAVFGEDALIEHSRRLINGAKSAELAHLEGEMISRISELCERLANQNYMFTEHEQQEIAAGSVDETRVRERYIQAARSELLKQAVQLRGAIARAYDTIEQELDQIERADERATDELKLAGDELNESLLAQKMSGKDEASWQRTYTNAQIPLAVIYQIEAQLMDPYVMIDLWSLYAKVVSRTIGTFYTGGNRVAIMRRFLDLVADTTQAKVMNWGAMEVYKDPAFEVLLELNRLACFLDELETVMAATTYDPYYRVVTGSMNNVLKGTGLAAYATDLQDEAKNYVNIVQDATISRTIMSRLSNDDDRYATGVLWFRMMKASLDKVLAALADPKGFDMITTLPLHDFDVMYKFLQALRAVMNLMPANTCTGAEPTAKYLTLMSKGDNTTFTMHPVYGRVFYEDADAPHLLANSTIKARPLGGMMPTEVHLTDGRQSDKYANVSPEATRVTFTGVRDSWSVTTPGAGTYTELSEWLSTRTGKSLHVSVRNVFGKRMAVVPITPHSMASPPEWKGIMTEKLIGNIAARDPKSEESSGVMVLDQQARNFYHREPALDNLLYEPKVPVSAIGFRRSVQ